MRRQNLLRICSHRLQCLHLQDELQQLSTSHLQQCPRSTGDYGRRLSILPPAAHFSTTAEHRAAQLTSKIDLLKSYGVREESIDKLVPFVRAYSVENLTGKVAFLEALGVKKQNVAKLIVCNPTFFSHSIEKHLQPKVDLLKDLGVKEDQFGKVVPHVLGRSLQGMLQKITFLESHGVERQHMGKVVSQFPRLFSYSLENNLKRKVTFLETEGLQGKGLAKLLTSHPEVLGRSVEGSLSNTVEYLRGKNIKAPAMAKALAPCAAVSPQRLEAGLGRLAEFGFRSTEASQILHKQPRILFKKAESIGYKRDFLVKTLQCSVAEARDVILKQPGILNQTEPSMLKKIEFLVQTMGCSLKDVLKFPKCLTSSLETKIKPRQRVLESLKSLNLLKKETDFLGIIIKMSEKEFLQKFVQGRPQAAAVFKGNVLMS